jgi:hypothetical protein
MYIENKSGSLNGLARIGRVTFSKSGRSLQYGGRTFQSLGGTGFKANYFDVETGEHFWISGPRNDGRDRLYEGSTSPSKSLMSARSIGGYPRWVNLNQEYSDSLPIARITVTVCQLPPPPLLQ